ncbi:MAG TPA: hypothetical protein VGP47_03750 [Parachlamydiaceae bacterium]|nr:hypothetical protein [Parachlamydiaceae bacterium]
MEMNRRALYNSLRMNWIMDPALAVEAWQVEDYRSIPLDLLFERLEDRDIRLNKSSFATFADSVDTPEDLTESLLHDSSEDMKLQDQVYLIIFELWRRLLPEKPCLSILCDEIDHQIHLHDQGLPASSEGVTDMLANLQVVLDENTDAGADPQEAFDCINSGCANDIESFLHDYISEKIDECNFSYGTELLDGFSSYVHDAKWFELLRARLVAVSDQEEANKIVKELIGDKHAEPDLEFNFEVLAFLVAIGDRETFESIARQTIELLQYEEDFQALVSISADFYHRMDKEKIETSLQSISKQRQKNDPEKRFDSRDPDLAVFLNIISMR